MKRKLFFFTLAALLFGYCGAIAQPELNVVWEKMIWPKEVKFAKFSKDGQWVYCAVNNNIEKLNPLTGEFANSFQYDITRGIYDMKISEAGNYIITSDSRGATLWSTAEEKAIRYISLYEQKGFSATEVDISPDEKQLLFSGFITTGPKPEDQVNLIYKYDLIKDSVIQEKTTPMYLTQIEYSPDGKYFAAGIYNEKYNELRLYDANTLAVIATLEHIEGEPREYVKFQFSNDGKYLASFKSNNKATIFELSTNAIYFQTDNSKLCFNIEILPDSKTFLIDYDDQNGNYETVYRTKDSILKLFKIYSSFITSFEENNIWKIFCGAGPYITLISNKTVSVKEDLEITFFMEFKYNLIKINSLVLIKDLTIIDTTGLSVFTKDFSSSPINNFSLENTFPSGTYICTITTLDGKTYSKTFQVVR